MSDVTDRGTVMKYWSDNDSNLFATTDKGYLFEWDVESQKWDLFELPPGTHEDTSYSYSQYSDAFANIRKFLEEHRTSEYYRRSPADEKLWEAVFAVLEEVK